MCGMIVAFWWCEVAGAEERVPTSAPSKFALQIDQSPPVSSYVWDMDRPILRNPYAPAVRQVSFATFDEPAVVPVPVVPDEEADPLNDSTVVTQNADDNPDLESRVRALEQLLAAPNVNDDDDDEPQGEKSVTTRLHYLEKSFADFEGEGSKFVEALSSSSRRIFNGRLQLDSWEYPKSSPGINAIENGDFDENPQNRILVRRARIGVHGTVPPDNMSYRLELEFSGQDGGRIRDAWLGWDDLPILNTLRIGNQKRPYGLDHLNSSNFMTFLERPFVVEAFNNANRRVGLTTYGVSPDKSCNWQFGAFNMVQIQDTNDIVGDNAQTELAGRLASSWWYDEDSGGRGYAHFALAGSLAFPDGRTLANQAVFRTPPEARSRSDWLDTGLIAGAKSYRLFAIESVFNVGALQLVGEWMNVQLQREAGAGSDIQLNGGYVAFSYFLTGEHIPWDRALGTIGRIEPFENFFCLNTCDGDVRSGLGAWQIALRLSRADFNDSDIQGGEGESLTLALNWYWNSHTRLQCNYIWGQINDRRTTLTNMMTPVVSGNYQVMGTRFMIDF